MRLPPRMPVTTESFAGDEDRRLMDFRPLPRRRQFPVAVDVAIPVQPAAKSCAPISLDHMGMVFGADPVRQVSLDRRIAEKAETVSQIERGIHAEVHRAHGELDIAFEFGFGNAGGLEILPVEIGDAAFGQSLQRPFAATPRRSHAEAAHGREDIGSKQRRVPCHGRAPVMADDDGLALSQRGDEGHHVADKVENRIGIDVVRCRGTSESPHIGGDGVKARGGEGRQLMTPRMRQFGPAMAEQNQRTGAFLGHEHLDAVDRDHS